VTGAAGASSHGVVEVYWYVGTVGALLANGIIGHRRDHKAAADKVSAARSQAELASALENQKIDRLTMLNDRGRPLFAALGKVTASDQLTAANAATEVLRENSLNLAQSVLADISGSRTRVAFYALEEDRLVRQSFHGWNGCPAPRKDFMRGRSDHDDAAIEFAEGENHLIVEDLAGNPPLYFDNPTRKSYKNFIAVPVRADSSSYGMLVADADRIGALAEAHCGLLRLIADVFGAGLAHVAVLAEKESQQREAQPRHAKPGTL
jgi:hypothetical protein